jgi:GAF domain
MVMSAGSRNLPGLLEQAAVYRDAAGQLPPGSGQTLTQRAAHFASGVRFSLDDPEALRRLHKVTGGLRDASSLGSLLPRILDGALSLAGADFGNIQLLDPVTGSLRIVTQSGFGPEFLDYFAVVDDAHSACGRAAKTSAQTVITDVNADADFAPHRDIAAASGFRAVQSTPLVDYAGRLIGMVSTHHRYPYRPSGSDLQIIQLYGDFAGEVVARQLGTPAADDLDDPVGWAVLSALLSPGNGQAAGLTVPPGPADGPRGREQPPAHRSASADGTMSRFTADIVNRLFSIGLSLESARSIVAKGPAGDRIAAATDEVDRAIRDIRTAMFNLARDPGQPSPAGPGR